MRVERAPALHLDDAATTTRSFSRAPPRSRRRGVRHLSTSRRLKWTWRSSIRRSRD